MTSSIQRLALLLGLPLFSALILTPVACAASLPTHADADVPAPIAQQLNACAAEHKTHLGSAQHSISFKVELAEGGEVDSVVLKDSTLGDEGLEACMAGALRSLSMDELPIRASGNHSRTSVGPESRAFLGQEQVLLCLASPPCLLALGMVVGASFIAVQIFVHAAQSSTTKPWAPPIATTMPIAGDDKLEYEKQCWPFYEQCLDNMAQPAWNQKDYGPMKDCGACLRDCKNHSKGVWPDKKCPRN